LFGISNHSKYSRSSYRPDAVFWMTILLITLWFSGHSMTIDVERVYGIKTMESCNFILSTVIQEYSANKGVCFIGDILNRLEES